MSQLEQGQHSPHNGPPEKVSALARILSTEWPVDSSPLSHDIHVSLIEAVWDLKEEAARANSSIDTQLEF